MPLEGDTLVTILKHLREHVSMGDVPRADVAKSARRQEVRSCREDEDGGRVRWMFAECSYQIMFDDEQGQRRRTSKGLKVSRNNVFGQVLDAAAFQQARLATLNKARALWNEFDKSAVSRYDVSQSCWP